MPYNCTNPYYSTADNSSIEVIWDNPEFGLVPFLACIRDQTEYGPQIYEEARRGEYGTLVSYEDSHWYCTVEKTIWNGCQYNVGDLMLSPLGVQPPNSTNQPIPIPSPFRLP